MRVAEPYHHSSKIIAMMVILVLLSVPAFAQQKVQFTQYMFNGLVINPAYAGADEALSLTFVHRSQWTGVENAPTTQTLSAHTLFRQKHVGVGVTLVNDRIGAHKNFNALTNYAYHIKVGSNAYFSMGLQAGIHNRRSDYGSLTVTAPNDPKLYNAFVSQTFFDVGMGVYFRSPRLHVGISAPELIPEKITANDTLSLCVSRVNFFIFSKYIIPLNEDLAAEPGVLLKCLSGVPVSFDANINMIYRRVLTLGLSYRKSESVDLLFKGQLTPQLQFGYSYDHPIGEVSALSNGSHEIMVQYLFRYAQRNVASPR